MPAFPVPGREARRILVFGVTGSGKTTLARRIGAVTGLPSHEIDSLTWEANWVVATEEDQRERVGAVLAQDEWVVDHCYSWMIPAMLSRADLVIGLDYARHVSLGRLVRRSLLNISLRRPTCNGNVETWRKMVAHDSIIRWHFGSFARKRDRMRTWAAGIATHGVTPPPTLLLTSPAQTERYLAYVAREIARA